ncbi:MAG: SUMF1/EgtB/PvdO family nonheme iron enzyme, partial [Planctomycetota bacterium]
RDTAGSVAEWTSSSAAWDAVLAVRRGASWGYEAETCRSASRIVTDGRGANPHVGFRVVRELK